MTTGQITNHWQELQSKIEYLRQTSTYPDSTTTIETVETHMSWVFLTDQYAYKLKKPVHLAFLDFTTLEARHLSANKELKLNQALAPGVYIEVLPLLADRDKRFHLGTVSDTQNENRIVDWLLKMKRLPRHLMLDQTLGMDHSFRERLYQAIKILTEFYRLTAHIRITPAEYREHLRIKVEKNHEILSLPGYGLDEKQLKHVYKTQLEQLEVHRSLFDQRVREGRIVDGHGDLRPEHICLTSPPVIIDRFELDPQERIIDPVDELSFLYMECDMLGHPDAGMFVFDTYRQLSGDDYPVELTRFFRSLRACTRARFSAWHLDDPWVRDRDKWRWKAAAYLGLAGTING
ncbi:MAG: hypothetical protein WD709_04080 [Gammaproteobacteria bacterium]